MLRVSGLPPPPSSRNNVMRLLSPVSRPWPGHRYSVGILILTLEQDQAFGMPQIAALMRDLFRDDGARLREFPEASCPLPLAAPPMEVRYAGKFRVQAVCCSTNPNGMAFVASPSNTAG